MDKAIILDFQERAWVHSFLKEYLRWHRGERTTLPTPNQSHIAALEAVMRQTQDT